MEEWIIENPGMSLYAAVAAPFVALLLISLMRDLFKKRDTDA